MNIDAINDRLHGDLEARAELVTAVIEEGIPLQIRAMLSVRGWTQAELAERAGVAQATVSEILNGRATTASVATLQKLAAALDVALEVRFCTFEELLAWAEHLERTAPGFLESL